ncbi:MAG: hypothetical protein BM564_08595 [Bacteroidetes bacterium MedPE-SWsnd-G2]|nr:MAG: hypothetical protein BM564_08595 [Bacteroidetes bacterium MedPE-SWsnd-G2]
MKSKLLLLTFLLFNFSLTAQISFEPGKIVLNSGETIACLIKNYDWSNNPSEITIKKEDKGIEEKFAIKDIKAFEITEVSKFVRATVDIDKSSNMPKDIDYEKQPKFEKERVFLKVLIEGTASLYYYRDGNMIRYFHLTKNQVIKQLIHKKYLKGNAEVYENNHYKQQLWNSFQNSCIKQNQIVNADYRKKSLEKLFNAYNTCEDANYVIKENTQNKYNFNLGLKAGVQFNSLSMNNQESGHNFDTNWDKETSFRIGLEAELVFPFNKNKWAAFIEPTYQSYSSEKEIIYYNSFSIIKTAIMTIDYSSIEIPIGFRHYMFLNENSKLFLNLGLKADLTIKGDLHSDPENLVDLDISSQTNIVFGFGYKFKDKFSAEVRMQTNQELLGDYISWYSDYSGTAIIFGYHFL